MITWTDHGKIFGPVTRAYYPTVLYDANAFSGHGDSDFKMYYSGVSGESYAIGYKTGTLPGGGGPPEGEGKPVGGVFLPTNKFGLLAPWIGLSLLLVLAAVSAVYLKRRGNHA